MFLINYMESVAFGVLAYDATKGRAKHISTQTCVALTLSLVLGVFNLPRDYSRKIHKLILVFLGCMVASFGCYAVAKDSQANGEDHLTFHGPNRGSYAVIYVAALVCGLLSLLVACGLSPSETKSFMMTDTQSLVCTFQNFLHAFALLPQLVLCRRQRFVSPAALRFLVVLGTKHLYEFISDAYVSYEHYLRGKLHLHEFSFMSGDLVAAIILLDFLYLVLVDERTLLLLLGVKEMELHDEEAQEEAEISRWQGWRQALQPLLESPERRRKLVQLLVLGLLGLVLGVQLGVLNVYACLGAAAIFGIFRGVQMYQDYQVPKKCCV